MADTPIVSVATPSDLLTKAKDAGILFVRLKSSGRMVPEVEGTKVVSTPHVRYVASFYHRKTDQVVRWEANYPTGSGTLHGDGTFVSEPKSFPRLDDIRDQISAEGFGIMTGEWRSRPRASEL